MSYTLEFRVLSRHRLEQQLARPDPAIAEAVRRTQWSRLCAEEGDAATQAWTAALDSIARRGGATQPVTASEDEALAIVATTRHLGELIGALDHSGSAGDAFHRDFLAGLAAGSFHEPALDRLLLERPIFGLAGEDFPSWGGLDRAELTRMLERYRPPAGQPLGDLAEWLEELAMILRLAERKEQDVVTLYL